MSDAEIITAVTINEKMPENDEDVNAEDTIQPFKISHREGLKAIETHLQYLILQSAPVMDLMFLRRIREEAVKRRV
ncbi:hypothetical protein TNCV_664491 [Trichonephila clavipes]|nr:hypothetical protein TNCV_664491 [Trichonephila clavipes]